MTNTFGGSWWSQNAKDYDIPSGWRGIVRGDRVIAYNPMNLDEFKEVGDAPDYNKYMSTLDPDSLSSGTGAPIDMRKLLGVPDNIGLLGGFYGNGPLIYDSRSEYDDRYKFGSESDYLFSNKQYGTDYRKAERDPWWVRDIVQPVVGKVIPGALLSLLTYGAGSALAGGLGAGASSIAEGAVLPMSEAASAVGTGVGMSGGLGTGMMSTGSALAAAGDPLGGGLTDPGMLREAVQGGFTPYSGNFAGYGGIESAYPNQIGNVYDGLGGGTISNADIVDWLQDKGSDLVKRFGRKAVETLVKGSQSSGRPISQSAMLSLGPLFNYQGLGTKKAGANIPAMAMASAFKPQPKAFAIPEDLLKKRQLQWMYLA